MSLVPGARRAIAVLRHLAQTGPVPAAAIARDVGLPRSTTYQLLQALAEEALVVHLPEERRYGLGPGVVELGSAYSRHAPLARLGRPVLTVLVDRVRHSAHLVVLHGNEVFYVVEQRAPGRPGLVTDVGVRLPAHLTASGRAMLAALPGAQVRALYPDRTAFSMRTGTGPTSLTQLQAVLSATRRRGYAVENGEVTTGFASIADLVRDHTGHPIAAVAVTYPTGHPPAPGAGDAPHGDQELEVVRAVRAAAAELTRRVGGRAKPPYHYRS